MGGNSLSYEQDWEKGRGSVLGDGQKNTKCIKLYSIVRGDFLPEGYWRQWFNEHGITRERAEVVNQTTKAQKQDPIFTLTKSLWKLRCDDRWWNSPGNWGPPSVRFSCRMSPTNVNLHHIKLLSLRLFLIKIKHDSPPLIYERVIQHCMCSRAILRSK